LATKSIRFFSIRKPFVFETVILVCRRELCKENFEIESVASA
jgi:hypothetical protein